MESNFKVKLVWPVDKNNLKHKDYSNELADNTNLVETNEHTFLVSSGLVGNSETLNPEVLLLSALSSCHFMTFYSIANKARLGLRYYEDNSELFLEGDKIKFASKINLNVKMKFNTDVTKEKVLEIHEKAHKYCIVANSIKAQVNVNVEIL
ncbi:MAG: redox protein OsmC [Candidatus Sericytochromatia bacterium]|nr:MAG: redox protein OsmC [Candidatus Sericytochromatia bacterium]